MAYPSMIRNVMVAGHIHHGKTALLDMLVFETHQLTWDVDQPVNSALVPSPRHANMSPRLDILILTLSLDLAASPSNLHPCHSYCKNSKGKSSLVNVIDTPGHVNFAGRSRFYRTLSGRCHLGGRCGGKESCMAQRRSYDMRCRRS